MQDTKIQKPPRIYGQSKLDLMGVEGREHKFEWMGKEGGSGRSQRRGEYDQTHCTKFSKD